MKMKQRTQHHRVRRSHHQWWLLALLKLVMLMFSATVLPVMAQSGTLAGAIIPKIASSVDKLFDTPMASCQEQLVSTGAQNYVLPADATSSITSYVVGSPGLKNQVVPYNQPYLQGWQCHFNWTSADGTPHQEDGDWMYPVCPPYWVDGSYSSGAKPELTCANENCPDGQRFFAEKSQCGDVRKVEAPAGANPANNGKCDAGDHFCSDPIHLGTGNNVVTQLDYASATPKSGLTVIRTYNSLPSSWDADEVRSFGRRWTMNYDARIQVVTNPDMAPPDCWKRPDTGYVWCDSLNNADAGQNAAAGTTTPVAANGVAMTQTQAVAVLRGDGKRVFFQLNASNDYQSNTEPHSHLRAISVTSATAATSVSPSVPVIASAPVVASGIPLAASAANSSVASTAISAVTSATPPTPSSASGRSGWEYTAEDDHTETFDANGVLLQIAERSGSTQLLTYSNGISNDSQLGRYPENAPICSHVASGPVVPAGTLLCVTNPWGEQLQFEHTVHGRVSSIIDPAGQVTRYEYDGATGGCHSNAAENPANPDALASSVSASAAENGTDTTPENTARINAGVVAAPVPDAATSSPSLGCTAENLTAVTSPDGAVSSLFYNEAAYINGGIACPGVVPQGHGYAGMLNALTGIVNADQTRIASWGYDCRGLINASRLGHGVTMYQIAIGPVDAAGMITSSITSPRGSQIQYVYKMLRGVARVVRVSRTSGDGSDAGGEAGAVRLFKTSQNTEHDTVRVVYSRSYDANGYPVSYNDESGTVFRTEYNDAQRLETMHVVTPVKTSIMTTQWHPVYRLPLLIAEPHRLTSFIYNPDGNLMEKKVQASNDASGEQGLAPQLTGKPFIWQYSYNAVGQLLSKTSPAVTNPIVASPTQPANAAASSIPDAGRVSVNYYTHDSNGNLHTVTNDLDQVVTLDNYDANGHVGSITEATGLRSEFRYTPRGWLQSQGRQGKFSRFRYNPEGLLTEAVLPESDAADTVLMYAYDEASQLKSIADESGNRILYGLNPLGQRVQIQVSDDRGLLLKRINRATDELGRPNRYRDNPEEKL